MDGRSFHMKDVIIIISGGDKGMNKLTVIGAGAMAEALISGMIENQLLESKKHLGDKQK